MFFSIPRVALISTSVLTLAILNGCSNNLNDLNSSPTYSQGVPATSIDNQYDSYYGSPKSSAYQAKYQSKIKRTVIRPTASFKRNAPKRYVVKKGDTLWGISNLFLNNPAYWPEIWDKNQRVKNPHLIYPGDILYIYQGSKKVKRRDGSYVEKMVPQMRIERKGLTGKPISTLAPFLVWSHVLDKDTVDNAPYVVGAKEGHMLFEKGQTIYVKNLSDRHAGGRYAVFHKGEELIDPDTKIKLGYDVTYTGFLEVEKPANYVEVATATIAESIREIRPGDKLLAEKDETSNLTAPIQIPRIKVRGTVISMFDAHLISGENMVITINKGAKDGYKPGFTLGIYAPPRTIKDPIKLSTKKYSFQPDEHAKVTLPPERAATAIVYKVLNDISYALITGSTNAVKKGYKIGNP